MLENFNKEKNNNTNNNLNNKLHLKMNLKKIKLKIILSDMKKHTTIEKNINVIGK